jgi:predicted MFS family arabinose efflux permease
LPPVLAAFAIPLLPAASGPGAPATFTFDFRPVFRNRAFMAYVLAFSGNIWEVSAVRAWFVAYLDWTLSLPDNHLPLPSLAVISGVASLIGFPVSIAVAEFALRWGPRVIVTTCLGSVVILLTLALMAGGPTIVVLVLLILAQIAAIADASAMAAGAVAAADPARRGAALAVYAFFGYTAAFVGPVAVGIVLDAFGGAGSPFGWSAAFVTMAFGSTAAAWALRGAGRDLGRPARHQ